MADKTSRFPSKEEMDARILRNLERLRGYVEELLSEIEDPEKSGPESSDEEWREEAEKLSVQLDKLKDYLESSEME